MGERDFREKLNPEQYRVMREKGDENAYSGKYWDHFERGIYTCAACGSMLFLSLHKFDSKDGWPSFTRAIKANVELKKDSSEKTELCCKKCGSHLGYSIEGQKKFYRVNSVCLDFQELPELNLDSGKDDDSGSDKKKDQQLQPVSNAAGGSALKTISLTLGALTVGVAVGAGSIWTFAPQPICTQPIAVQQTAPTPQTSTTGVTRPTTTSATVAPGQPASTASTSVATTSPASSAGIP